MAETSNMKFMEQWLDQLPEEEIQRQMDDLNNEISRLAAQLNTLREALELKRRFRDFYRPQITREVHGQDAGAGTDVAAVNRDDRPSSIRESVLAVMAEPGRDEWPVNDLYTALVQRQWLEGTTQALRSLSASLSRMTAEGDIVRVRRGVYKLAVPEAASQSLLDLGGDPD